jgi:hypothetical protein
MQLSVIVDRSGRLIAAMKRDGRTSEGPGPRVGIRPARADHQLHHIDLPTRFETFRIRQIVPHVKVYTDGRPPEIPD